MLFSDVTDAVVAGANIAPPTLRSVHNVPPDMKKRTSGGDFSCMWKFDMYWASIFETFSSLVAMIETFVDFEQYVPEFQYYAESVTRYACRTLEARGCSAVSVQVIRVASPKISELLSETGPTPYWPDVVYNKSCVGSLDDLGEVAEFLITP